MCLLVLMVATDAPLEGTPKTQFCNIQTFFVNSPDVEQGLQALEKHQRLYEKCNEKMNTGSLDDALDQIPVLISGLCPFYNMT